MVVVVVVVVAVVVVCWRVVVVCRRVVDGRLVVWGAPVVTTPTPLVVGGTVRTGATVLGVPARLIPAEEMIWSKGFIMERERYDGADIAHVLHARAESLDWRRLLLRFGRHWRVLFSHFVLFGFIYPSERARIPAWVMTELTRRLQRETASVPVVDPSPICRRPILSRQQYLPDIEGGYRDVRLTHESAMNEDDIQLWTDGIKIDGERPAA